MAFEAYLIIFMGIPSGPVAFLGFRDFIMELMSFTVGFGKSKTEFVKFPKFSLIFIILFCL